VGGARGHGGRPASAGGRADEDDKQAEMGQVKKLMVLAVAAGVVVGAWWVHGAVVRRGRQGNPVRTVEAFMASTRKVGSMLWDEETRKQMEADQAMLERLAAEGEEEVPADVQERYDIVPVKELFRSPSVGKGTAAAFAMLTVESYEVEESTVEGKEASVRVRIMASDIFGLRQAMADAGLPAGEAAPQPRAHVVVFELQQSWHRWYIVNVEGDLGKMGQLMSRLRR
jgi:hypothetical protein